MNAMMASPKRFLVSAANSERLKRAGSEEYLIEFLLWEGTNAHAFATAYAGAALPANGPAITKPLSAGLRKWVGETLSTAVFHPYKTDAFY